MANKPTVDRLAASSINPLISSVSTEDTLHAAAVAVHELGFMVAETELAKDHVYLLFDAITCALRWESKNLRPIAHARQEASDE